VVEEALKTILREAISLDAAGRTDAGVHALGQVATFTTSQPLDPHKLTWQLNSVLPSEIAVKSCDFVDLNFHPRYHAKKRTYYYYLLNSPVRFPFWHRYCWWVARPLNWAAIKQCLPLFMGTNDFASFTVNQEKATVRTVYHFDIQPNFALAEGLYCFRITADGFLHHMVRLIVGTLVWVGTGKLNQAEVKEIIAAKDVSKAGPKAPARGLFLAKVEY
jgi:tRNA pseudouridine38-40 synthase